MNKLFLIWFIMCTKSLSEAVRVREYNGTFDQRFPVNVSKNNEVIILYDYTKTSNYSTYLRAFVDATVPKGYSVFVTIDDGSDQLEYIKLIYRDKETMEHAETTICPIFNVSDRQMLQPQTLTVVISTESIDTIVVTIQIKIMTDFILETNSNRTVNISDTSSVFLLSKFDDLTEQVNVMVNSTDSNTSMIFSIQEEKCQVFDLDENVKYKGNYQTVTGIGSMVVQKSKTSKRSFIIVFVFNLNEGNLWTKSLTVEVKKILNHSAYLLPIIYAILSLLGVFLSTLIVDWICYKSLLKNRPDCFLRFCELRIPPTASLQSGIRVSDLSRLDPNVLKNEYNLYIWFLIIVFLSYFLPVIQHVIGHQLHFTSTGNQDKCFFNYRCVLPLGIFMAFNNMISNIGYVIGGIIFICIVRIRQYLEKIYPMSDIQGERIMKYYGLSYSMGIGLIIEGILSASYHICPNKHNFQFDMTYMYLLACICTVKLYQGRYPDIAPSAKIFYSSMAVVGIFAVLGVKWDGVILRSVFFVVHVASCIILAIILHNKGNWTWLPRCNLQYHEITEPVVSESGENIAEEYNEDRATKCRRLRKIYDQVYKYRILIFFFFGNIAMAIFGVSNFEINLNLLIFTICIGNLSMYIIIYMIMKIIHHEWCYFMSIIYFFIAIIFWVLALPNFLHGPTHWEMTAAASRNFNQPCRYFEFYDVHDVWHIASSIALFFSFMVIINIDDNLLDRDRHQIPMF